MTPSEEAQLLGLADEAHKRFYERDQNLALRSEWFLTLGSLLDKLQPISFWRNTGIDREADAR